MNIICKIFGHKQGDGNYKQYCKRCEAWRVLHVKRFPEIGEAQIDWTVFEELNFKKV